MTMPGGGGQSTDTRDANVNLNANVDAYVSGMQAAEQQTNRTASAIDRLDAKVQSLQKRAAGGLIHFAEADFAVLGGATADAATFEKQLGVLNATAAVTKQNFAGAKGAVESAFTSLPVSRTQIIQLAEALNNLGVTGSADLGKLITTFVKLGAATGEGPAELAQGLVQLSRLMGQTNANQIANYANSLLTVSKNSGVSATGVLSFAQAIAPMARQAGIGEAAVLGISAAFSKAGADGYVAANTFNSIVSDITQLTQSGSPELSKYANLIGVTVKQFKGMDKTTALQDIFNTISKQGPAAINTLNRLGIDGVRAQSAIAAVVQSGDLNGAIAQAQGASGNQNNLNKGAHAAMANLADDLAKLRNNFTQFGTEIGTTFLKPLEAAVGAVNRLFSAMNTLLKPFAPIIAGLAAIAGGVSAMAGGALGIAGIIGAGALARTALRSGPRRAFREGMSAGQGVAGESEEERVTRLGTNPSAVAYARYQAGGRMPLRARIPYLAGQGVGALRAPIDPNAPVSEGPSGFRQTVRGFVRAPFVAATGVMRGQTTFMANAAANDYARTPYAAMMGAERIPMSGNAPNNSRTFAMGATGSSAAAKAEEANAVAAKESATGFRENLKAQLALNKASVEGQGTMGALWTGAKDVTKAFVQLGVQTARTGASLVGVGGARVAEAGATRSLAGRAVGGVGGLLSSIGPLGAAFIGLPLLAGIKSKVDATDRKPFEVDNMLDPITKYNQALGTTATNLANFSSAVTDATGAVGGAATTLAGAAKVTPSDVQTATSGYKVVDSGFTQLAGAAPKNTQAAVAYIQSLGVTQGSMDPKTLSSIKNDLIATYGKDQAQTILSAYTAAGANSAGPTGTSINYSALGSSVRDKGNTAFKSVIGAGLSGAQAQAQPGAGAQSSKAELGRLLQLGGSALQSNVYGGDKDSIQSMRALLAKTFGGKPSDYDQLVSTDTSPNAPDSQISYKDPATIQRRLIEAISNTKGGKSFLGNAGINLDKTRGKGGLYDNNQIDKLIQGAIGTPFAAAGLSGQGQAISKSGPLGQFAESSSLVQRGYNAPSDPSLQYQSMQALYQNAGGSLNGGPTNTAAVDAALDKLKGTINDTSDQLYIMAKAAKSYADQQAQYAMQFQSRPQQLAQTAAGYQEAFVANRDHPTDDTAADLSNAQASYQSQLATQTQFEIQSQQQAKAYGVQMQRSAEDNQRQIMVSERDFHKQQLYAQEDYQLSTLRAQQDYAIQLQRQAQSTAQSIYNPFNRVQAQYTTGAGVVVENLADQNKRIADQLAQLKQLKSAGLTQQSIDTLDLSNPNNAQQTAALATSLASDPSLIAEINKQTAARLSATTALTQSSFSITYRQTSEDFKKQIDRGAQDYKTATQRAVDAQQTAMNDMAYSYNLMVKRSGQDLTTSMTELYGAFGDQYGKTLAAINADIGKYAPGLAKMLTTEITAMQNAVNTTIQVTTIGTANPVTSNSHPAIGGPAHAMGAISTQQHQATVSEGNRPEMWLPLDARGQQFMVPFYQGISMQVLKGMQSKQFGSMPSGSGGMNGGGATEIDQSTNFTGPITVQASDPKAMQRKLEAQKRLKALSQPKRPGGR